MAIVAHPEVAPPPLSLLLRECRSGQGWDRLGLALLEEKEHSLALAAFTEARRHEPDSLKYALHGIEAAVAAGQAEMELARVEQWCEDDPLDPIFPLVRGILLDRLGFKPAAIDALTVAAALAPESPVAALFLGGLLARSNRLREADQALARASELDPDNPMPINDRAAVLIRLHRHGEARRILLDILARPDTDISVLSNLVTSTMCLGMQEEAIELAWRAVDRNTISALPWRGLCNALPYCFGAPASEMLAVAQSCADRLPRMAPAAFANAPDPDRKLTIGLMSGTLRTHPVGWLTIAGFEALDRARFDLVCLGDSGFAGDPIQKRFRAIASDWRDIGALDDVRLAAAARASGIDILVDLGGYGDAARMQACAHRLAPVQIKWVGMQNHSTGLPEIDWFMTDRWETPPALENRYSERLLRLPDGYVCYSPPSYAPEVAPLPALTNGYITFGCFNNLAKVTTAAIGAWAEILRLLPYSRLVLKTHQFAEAETVERIQADFLECGITADRIEPRGPSSHRGLLAGYNDIDIVLDPFPYAGGLTTCEALWMGVPTVALAGETFSARHSTSHLSNVGLDNWVAEDIGGYIERVLEKAADLPALAILRRELRERMRAGPLCDAERFGEHFGILLRHAWRQWCDEALLN
jgi:protein O-GlcNAc transferase